MSADDDNKTGDEKKPDEAPDTAEAESEVETDAKKPEGDAEGDAKDDDAKDDDAKDDDAKDEREPLGKKAREEYPLADDHTLRKAGAGCITAFVVVLVVIYGLFHWVFSSITELDSRGMPSEPVATADAGAEARPVVWLPSLADASSLAEASGRPLLVFVGSEGELSAARLRDHIFSGPEMTSVASAFVAVSVDLPRADAPTRVALQHLGVETVPLVMVLRPDRTRLVPDVTVVSTPTVRRALARALLAMQEPQEPTPPTEPTTPTEPTESTTPNAP